MHIITFSQLILRDILPIQRTTYEPDKHLQAAIEWLCRAHDKSPDDGVSYGYSMRGGWRPSYRETSGYIATTFFNLAKAFQNPTYKDRAVRIVKWLCLVQNNDGSFSNPKYHKNQGIVFDTGQDLFGLVRAYKETGHDEFLKAAERAGDWLVMIADEEGRWTRNTHLGIPHVYNSRSAWALLQLNEICPDNEKLRVAKANLDWAVSQEQHGFFEQCAFERGKAPFTHTIAYAIRGLWESSQILKDSKYAETATRAAEATIRHVGINGFIPGQIDSHGNAKANYCCLTGNAQLAIIWAKLHTHTSELIFRDAAVNALRYVMMQQNITTNNYDIRGAIKGSQPIWGSYSRLTYPNWATKFFIDALLLCREWM